MRAYRMFGFAAVVMAFVLSIASLVWSIMPALSQGTSLWPLATTITSISTTASVQIIAANPTRRLIQICNPSNTLSVWIAPAPTAAAPFTAGSWLLPPIASTANFSNACFTSPIANSQGVAWNAITSEGATLSALGQLTIYEY